jgi:hypothetical protein
LFVCLPDVLGALLDAIEIPVLSFIHPALQAADANRLQKLAVDGS